MDLNFFLTSRISWWYECLFLDHFALSILLFTVSYQMNDSVLKTLRYSEKSYPTYRAAFFFFIPCIMFLERLEFQPVHSHESSNILPCVSGSRGNMIITQTLVVWISFLALLHEYSCRSRLLKETELDMTHILRINTVPLARSTAIPEGLIRIYIIMIYPQKFQGYLW